MVGRVGFIGLGNMGEPMARNLARAGFELTLRDVDVQRQERLASEFGARAADSPDAFADADAVVTMLPTGAHVRDVVLDWGLADSLSLGTAVVDMSSSEPTGTRELGAELARRGLRLVDAPVSGGVARAGTGELAIMAGGDAAAVERVRPVLDAIGQSVVYVGELGNGHAVKALNNYVAAATFASTSEALLVGERFGLDPATIIEVLNRSTGRSFSSELTFLPHVVERGFATGFGLALMTKDVGIAAQLAAELGMNVPSLELQRRMWTEALEGEAAGADFTAAYRHWERVNGAQSP